MYSVTCSLRRIDLAALVRSRRGVRWRSRVVVSAMLLVPFTMPGWGTASPCPDPWLCGTDEPIRGAGQAVKAVGRPLPVGHGVDGMAAPDSGGHCTAGVTIPPA